MVASVVASGLGTGRGGGEVILRGAEAMAAVVPLVPLTRPVMSKQRAWPVLLWYTATAALTALKRASSVLVAASSLDKCEQLRAARLVRR